MIFEGCDFEILFQDSEIPMLIIQQCDNDKKLFLIDRVNSAFESIFNISNTECKGKNINQIRYFGNCTFTQSNSFQIKDKYTEIQYCPLCELYIEYKFRKINDNYYFLQINDITENYLIKYERNVLDKISSEMLKSVEVNNMLNSIMSIILKSFNADRAWLLNPADPNSDNYLIPFLKTKDKWKFDNSKKIQMDLETSKSISEIISLDNVVQLYSTKVPYLARLVVKKHGVKSSLNKAIIPRIGKPWILGIHSCEEEQKWHPGIVKIFGKVADRIKDSLDSMLFFNEMKMARDNFENIFNNMNDAIFIHDSESCKIVDVNNSAIRMMGVENKEKLLNEIPSKFTNNDETYNKGTALSKIKKVAETKKSDTFIWNSMKQNGEPFWTEVSLSYVEISGEKRVLAVVRDISSRIKIQRELKESEEKFKIFAQTTSAAVMIYQNNKWVYANPGAERICGYNLDELQNMEFWSFYNEPFCQYIFLKI